MKFDNTNSEIKREKENTFSNSQNAHTSISVDDNLQYINSQFGNGIGLSHGKFNILGGEIGIGIAYIENICDKELINNHVIAPLLQNELKKHTKSQDIAVIVQTLYIASVDTQITDNNEHILEEILKGNTVIFFELSDKALIINSKKVEKRSIGKPENEATILSGAEAFTEDIETNTSMIIKRLSTTKLKFETFTLGRLSKSTVKIVWLEGIANNDIINELRGRINNIDIDLVEGSGFLSELIHDKPVEIFPQYKQTERPDMVSKKLSEGGFAIISSNSPFALIGPTSFWDGFKTMDDYSETSIASSSLRLIRYIAFFIATIASPLYLSFVTYNHTIVPPSLALDIANGRAGVPFPTIIELIVMTIIIDIIREAGFRMPGVVGYFIGTLGAVVIGQAAVTAGYVSASLIIVVAFSAIASFAISSTLLINTARLINYFLILLSGVLGTFGLLNGLVIILWRMTTLETLGVPYLYPLFPIELQGLKDLFIRVPLKMIKVRLKLFSPTNRNKRKK